MQRLRLTDHHLAAQCVSRLTPVMATNIATASGCLLRTTLFPERSMLCATDVVRLEPASHGIIVRPYSKCGWYVGLWSLKSALWRSTHDSPGLRNNAARDSKRRLHDETTAAMIKKAKMKISMTTPSMAMIRLKCPFVAVLSSSGIKLSQSVTRHSAHQVTTPEISPLRIFASCFTVTDGNLKRGHAGTYSNHQSGELQCSSKCSITTLVKRLDLHILFPVIYAKQTFLGMPVGNAYMPQELSTSRKSSTLEFVKRAPNTLTANLPSRFCKVVRPSQSGE
ncbi:hypothetical protein OPT61_g9488 [Boeremia exigua]|uniref:Uncharacterized protein n=1 Tax=Boeremia exigua TaxID=749465 RepID=A0ACC2HUN4_9PLEO|nr:hypothetical protein OPT61_g9488 [Boeremia exigua]